MDINNCPLCGNEYASEHVKCTRSESGDWGTVCSCEHFNDNTKFVVHESVDVLPFGEDPILRAKLYNCIASILLRNRYAKNTRNLYWKFFYEKDTEGNPIDDPVKINLANEIRNYPENFNDRVDKSLINYSTKYPKLGEQCFPFVEDNSLLYGVTTEDDDRHYEVVGMLEAFVEYGYMRKEDDNCYTITAKGWSHINDRTREENEIKQGFIAMAFSKETEEIGKAFHETILDCGYPPRRIDQKEHNNQIVPEIFFEIKRSKFLVVDITVPNHGAYYEAGYGEALNKQVIVCCRADAFNDEDKEKRPHFDIAQKSAVVWKDLDDLKDKLKKRIEATVGLASKSAIS